MVYGVLYSIYFCDSSICKRPQSRETQQYLVLRSLPSMALDAYIIFLASSFWKADISRLLFLQK